MAPRVIGTAGGNLAPATTKVSGRMKPPGISGNALGSETDKGRDAEVCVCRGHSEMGGLLVEVV